MIFGRITPVITVRCVNRSVNIGGNIGVKVNLSGGNMGVKVNLSGGNMPLYDLICSGCGCLKEDVILQHSISLDMTHVIIYPEPLFCDKCGRNLWRRRGIEVTCDRGSVWTRECSKHKN